MNKLILKNNIQINNWIVLKVNSKLKHKYRKILSECRCIKCNQIQIIEKFRLEKGDNVKCKSCRKIFLDSQIGTTYNNLTILSYLSSSLFLIFHIYSYLF
jgi:ribosomal protein S27E